MPEQNYDVVIIGAGPAGLMAGVYTSRDRMRTLIIERGLFGGQITTAGVVENFPGFPEGIEGIELGERMRQQAEKFGANIITAEVSSLEIKGEPKVVKTSEGDFTARVVILAGGSERAKMGVPGEAEFTGKGVSYCATCDAAFFRDKRVAVVGGGDAAITEALHLARFASHITLIHRRHEFRATRIMQERAFAEPKIEVLWDSVIEEVVGADFLKTLKLRNVKTGQKSTLDVAGVFVSIGFKPETGYLKGVVPLDEAGHVVTNEKMETNVPGVFAAGDIRHNSGRQAITAAGDGATAAIYAEKFLTEH